MKVRKKRSAKKVAAHIIAATTYVVTCNDEIIRPKNCAWERQAFRSLRGKGTLVAKLTRKIYDDLNRHNIRTHLVSGARGMKSNQFLAERLMPVPVRMVVRRLSFGSYALRHPTLSPLEILDDLVVEMFCDDPSSSKYGCQMVVDIPGRRILYFKPKVEAGIGYRTAVDFPKDDIQWFLIRKVVEEGRDLAMSAFATMHAYFMETNYNLVDASFSFGVNIYRDLVLAGTIDNQSWRIWKNYNFSRSLDASFLREAPDLVDDGYPKQLLANYRRLVKLVHA